MKEKDTGWCDIEKLQALVGANYEWIYYPKSKKYVLKEVKDVQDNSNKSYRR